MPLTGEDLTRIAQVRLLTNDVQLNSEVFSDTEMASFLDLEGQNVKRAAAQVLDTLASNEALLSKAITSRDVTTHGDMIAKALHERAESLRQQADSDDETDGGFYFDIIEPPDYPWSF